MLYCLLLGVDSNIKEQSDEIFETIILISLICTEVIQKFLNDFSLNIKRKILMHKLLKVN